MATFRLALLCHRPSGKFLKSEVRPVFETLDEAHKWRLSGARCKSASWARRETQGMLSFMECIRRKKTWTRDGSRTPAWCLRVIEAMDGQPTLPRTTQPESQQTDPKGKRLLKVQDSIVSVGSSLSEAPPVDHDRRMFGYTGPRLCTASLSLAQPSSSPALPSSRTLVALPSSLPAQLRYYDPRRGVCIAVMEDGREVEATSHQPDPETGFIMGIWDDGSSFVSEHSALLSEESKPPASAPATAVAGQRSRRSGKGE